MPQGSRILIVDDNDDLRTMLGYQLQARGYVVTMASDGSQAIQRCRDEHPDIVLMDVMMPGMDGTEAAAMLKDDPETASIPILFLTSLVQGQDAIRQDDARDRFTLPKSIEFDKLLYEIELALTKK